MTTLRLTAVCIALALALPFAVAQELPKVPAESGAPIVVKIASVEAANEGTEPDDPRATFGIVNRKEGVCYAVAPPTGASLELDESYALVPATDLDEGLRDKLKADFPNCMAVEAVAKVTH